MPPTIATALHTALTRLTHAGSAADDARLDAEVLLAHVLDQPRSHLRAWPERALTAAQTAHYEDLVTRRAAGEPVAYLCGRREFWSLELEVTPATLIPRPETELLVELALARIPVAAALAVADLGTGTGAIALAIARERPRCRVTATDRASAALDVARRNAARLGITAVDFRHGAWYAPLPDPAAGRYDLILSNPPYVRAGDPHLAQGDLRFEPPDALTAGADGLDALRVLVAGAPAYLHSGGWLLVEHGYDQAEAVTALFRTAGFTDIETFHDLGGQPRVTLGRRP